MIGLTPPPKGTAKKSNVSPPRHLPTYSATVAPVHQQDQQQQFAVDEESGKSKRRRPTQKIVKPLQPLSLTLPTAQPETPQKSPPAKKREDSTAAVVLVPTIPAAADLTVLVTRTDLYDAGATRFTMEEAEDGDSFLPVTTTEHHSNNNGGGASPTATTALTSHPNIPVAKYQYIHPNNNRDHHPDNGASHTVAICRVPATAVIKNPFWMQLCVFDKSASNSLLPTNPPLDRSVQKYWNQRWRLFSRFDHGIQLDQEGWFSVTPEQIADHVATRTVDLYYRTTTTNAATLTTNAMANTTITPQQQQQSQNMTVMDAFCGCGGNSIAFAKQAAVDQVICVDIDRSKLQRAANNAAIYQIPVHKIIFIECNVLFLLEHCYCNGDFILDQPIHHPDKARAMMAAMPPPVRTETTSHGYYIGGIDMLPRNIDVIFMDPPWGGVDYEIFGRNGYCLERNMRILRPAYQMSMAPTPPTSNEGVTDGFFDTFVTATHSSQQRNNNNNNKEDRKAAFNSGLNANNCVNGAELLQLAAAAAHCAQVVYDVPRNISRTSLGQAGLAAGYRGHCQLEEHYLNGRLKTVTAYFGTDFLSRSSLGPQCPENNDHAMAVES